MSSTPHTPTGVPDVDTGFLVPASGFARRRSRGRRRDAAMDRGDSIGHVDRTSRIQSEVIRGAEGLQAVLQLARRDVKPIGRRAAGSLTGLERRRRRDVEPGELLPTGLTHRDFADPLRTGG
jgi:hypothetical protein